MKAYPVKTHTDTPITPLNKALTDCRIALITTAGLYLNEQKPYNERIIGGDCSYREIPNSLEIQSLSHGHRSMVYDTSGAKNDVNLVFPLDRFRELEDDGKIGSLNRRHFSFMGSITKPKPLINETAPEVAQKLEDDKVDVVFLTPV